MRKQGIAEFAGRASSVARARCRAPLAEASLLPSGVRQSPFATFIDYRVQRPA